MNFFNKIGDGHTGGPGWFGMEWPLSKNLFKLNAAKCLPGLIDAIRVGWISFAAITDCITVQGLPFGWFEFTLFMLSKYSPTFV